ncbi:MAG: outer membrane lipoprotein carrier protein LolA [Rickettsiales bacterium]|nr:outer membrane lipoprotein carrier protein LolA [Rickettsiales bacterium]
MENRKLVDRVNIYFKAIDTMESDFRQSSGADGNISVGTFQIARSGKFKFEYLSSPKSVFISNGGAITYYDIELDEISVIPSSKMPIVFLLNGQLGLEELGAEILQASCSEDNCTIAAKIIVDGENYRVEYVFDREIKNLIEIDIVADGAQKIYLELSNTRINTALEKGIFIFKNPRIYKKRK